MTNTNDTVTRLRALANALALGEWIALTETCATAADEIERLRAERDEARRELSAARRELCRNEAIIRLQRHRVHRDSEDVVGLAKEIAVERGWDCFKENTND